MKLIDLLNKIAKGEIKYPIKWKCYGSEYEIEDEPSLADFHCMFNTLNGEIEIIEEPKKIEKTNLKVKLDKEIGCWKNLNSLFMGIVTLNGKINEIIDYINKGDSNE